MGSPYGSLSLTGEIRAYHVPHEYPLDELGSACPPVTRHLRETMGNCLHLVTYLLVQASQPLWLVGSHDVYQRFTYVSHVIPP